MGRLPPLLLLVAAAGCGAKTPKAAPADPADAAAVGSIAGPVVEHLDAGEYVYLRIKTDKGDVWAAVPRTPIENGTEVTMSNPMPMTNFESSALKRTFALVYFGTLAPAGGAAAPGAAPSPGAAPATGADPHAGIGANTTSAAVTGPIAKASGADAQTVAEAWSGKDRLAGKTVTIHGVVVKYNGGVMGKNWIHLQDGSGDAKAGTNDIAVTTLDTAAKGDTITVTGTVGTNRDFGAGYTYPVIIENAKIVRR